MCSLGNGRRLRFWKDFWCEEEPLSITFPSLFSLIVNEGALVAELWDLGGVYNFRLCFL